MKEIAHELNYDLTFHCSHNPLGMPEIFRVLGVYNFATTASFHILAVGMDFTKILTQDKGGIEKWAWPDGRMEKRKWSHKFRTGFFLCNCHLLLTLVKTAKVCQKNLIKYLFEFLAASASKYQSFTGTICYCVEI